jgi:hypothetical protein
MLFEDDVVAAVVDHWRADGWTIVSTALATQHGDDIVATRDGVRLVVEAKGEGSSKPYTKRYGSTFTPRQAYTHVSVAVLRTLRVVSEGTSTAAIALPADAAHRREVDRVQSALSRLGIRVFWVDQERGVSVQD